MLWSAYSSPIGECRPYKNIPLCLTFVRIHRLYTQSPSVHIDTPEWAILPDCASPREPRGSCWVPTQPSGSGSSSPTFPTTCLLASSVSSSSPFPSPSSSSCYPTRPRRWLPGSGAGEPRMHSSRPGPTPRPAAGGPSSRTGPRTSRAWTWVSGRCSPRPLPASAGSVGDKTRDR